MERRASFLVQFAFGPGDGVDPAVSWSAASEAAVSEAAKKPTPILTFALS